MPALIFLHGLLGTQEDWQPVIEKLAKNQPHFFSYFRCIAVDLPLHGEAKSVNVVNFEEVCAYLSQKIKLLVENQPFFLIGYSLGGRIALYYALQAQCEKGNLQGLILEGANLGLQTKAEKQVRQLHDQKWATRFATEDPHSVLNDWYRQPVFSHLNEQQRAELILKRSANCGENIAKMLLACGLAEQPDFSEKVRSNFLPIYYFVGEKDLKFRQMAVDNYLNYTIIENAGHNAHAENPQKFAEKLTALLDNHSLSIK